MVTRTLSFLLILSLLVGAFPAALLAAPPVAPLAIVHRAPADVPDAPTPLISLSLIGRYVPADVEFNRGAAEIVTHDPATQRLFIVNGQNNTIDIVSIMTPTTPSLVSAIAISPTYGAAAQSVAVANGVLAVAIQPPVKTDPGMIALFDTDGVPLSQATVGALPDMVTFTHDGTKVLAANEGEPNDAYDVDPEGSVSIVDIATSVMTPTVTTIGFADFNSGGPRASEIVTDVRIFGPGASVAQDLEPEYITVAPDDGKAYVTLQENNALAVINIISSTVEAVLPLGFKDHSQPGNALDASDRDGVGNTATISITTKPIFGMYQPDAIAGYTVSNTLYLVTANEGDARDYAGYSEESRVSGLTLDPTAFPGGAAAGFARLTVTEQLGDEGNDGDYERLYAFGARSFSIWNASSGALVFDSGDDMEQRIATLYPNNFNADGTSNDLDNRSDNKGPEPEGVTIGHISGRTYAFVGLERIGGVMVYDVSNPAAPTFVQYVLNRDFNQDPTTDPNADISPEGLIFVPAGESPNGKPLLIVAHELSGSTSIYEINSVSPADGAGTLSLLHNNDGESTLLPLDLTVAPGTGYSNTVTQTIEIAGVAAFKAVQDREIMDAKNLGNAVVNVYAGDAFLASSTLQCTLDDPNGPVYDAVAQRQMAYTTHVFGNHEFDYSPDFLKRFIDAFNGTQPFLSANLNFSPEASYAPLLDADGLLFEPVTDGRVIGSALIYTDTLTNQRFGIVGLTTPLLPTISTPRDVGVTVNLTATATVAQSVIDRLYDDLGVRKIIVVSHLQDVNNDVDLVSRLRRVDIAVGGGGDELLTNPDIPDNQELLPGDSASTDDDDNLRTYPLPVQDADGRTVYVVTSDGNYKYQGRLDVAFDANGEVREIYSERSYPRRVVVASAAATAVGISDAVTPDAGLVTAVETPIEACLTDLANTPVARSTVLLDVSRDTVRGTESNAGNLITDGFLYTYDQYADNVGLPPRSNSNRVIAMTNGGGIRQNAGNVLPVSGVISDTISRQNTIDVLPFANFLTVVPGITPDELKTILERSAASLPGAGGQFLQMAGIRVVYNAAQPVGSRVVSATLADGTPLITNGAPVSGAPTVSVVTNSFTANGGDDYPTFAAQEDKVNLTDDNGVAVSYEQAWREYLLSFPAQGSPSLPTIPADAAYRAGGEGRITIVETTEVKIYMPIIRR